MNAFSNLSCEALISRYFPAAEAAGTVSVVGGLSGGLVRIEAGTQIFAARRCLSATVPGVSLARQHRVLKRLAPQIGPQPYLLTGGWLVTEWLEGESCGDTVPVEALAELLHRLHGQPCFGWRIPLLTLLAFYWQAAAPERRSLLWLRTLRRLCHVGEPTPLKLSPLHMDVHGYNLIRTQGGLRLIDWEYAGDSDIALELAACGYGEPLIEAYAAQSGLNPERLARQVLRWQPWVHTLAASWYERRWQQTRQKHFIQLADDAWRRLQCREHER